ncbi:MAG TPA: hypothetical protein VH105_06265 [Burkholderiales bacterium]|jgi:hypothetical protein|nr:hypothetical protein [Burkholderiales bacterium]
MLRRLILAIAAGLLLAAVSNHMLCDAPNPTLANPAYCGPREWMTWIVAFLFGAGLVWVWQLWRRRHAQAAPASAPPPGAEEAARDPELPPEG